MPLLSWTSQTLGSISNPVLQRLGEPNPRYFNDTSKEVSKMRLMAPLPIFPIGEKNHRGRWGVFGMQERYLSSEDETSESPDESGNESPIEIDSKQRDYLQSIDE